MCADLSPSFYKSTHDRQCSPKVNPMDELIPARFNVPFGISSTWKIFKKQHEAVTYSREFGNGLLGFAFERSDGIRQFLAAHPAFFWWRDHKRNPADRRTYEVIIENQPSKLYLDLEFDRTCNPNHDGVRMTNIFINILCANLKREFDIDCDRSAVLDLDSTTNTKFSRHLIFQIENTFFRNNYDVGSFVRMVCDEIQIGCSSGKGLCGMSSESLKELFVNNKEKETLFCDLGVYTKNRHFRLFQSTKWLKNAPLVVSAENVFQPKLKKHPINKRVPTKIKNAPKLKKYWINQRVPTRIKNAPKVKTCRINKRVPTRIKNAPKVKKRRINKRVPTRIKNAAFLKQLFLDSLVTYITDHKHRTLVVPSATCTSYCGRKKTGKMSLSNRPVQSDSSLGNSPIPSIEKFIEHLVSPGYVRRRVYFLENKILNYDIAGNRYCHNIGRAHKSNNVKYVVDLKKGVYYQKCYDSDCALYRSPETQLPEKVLFLLDDENSVLKDVLEKSQNCHDALNSISSDNFPDFGLSDNDLLNSTMDVN